MSLINLLSLQKSICSMYIGGSGQSPSKKGGFLLKCLQCHQGTVPGYVEGKVTKSQNEVGDGASSRVYTGVFNGDTVAVKQLKCYSPRL